MIETTFKSIAPDILQDDLAINLERNYPVVARLLEGVRRKIGVSSPVEFAGTMGPHAQFQLLAEISSDYGHGAICMYMMSNCTKHDWDRYGTKDITHRLTNLVAVRGDLATILPIIRSNGRVERQFLEKEIKRCRIVGLDDQFEETGPKVARLHVWDAEDNSLFSRLNLETFNDANRTATIISIDTSIELLVSKARLDASL